MQLFSWPKSKFSEHATQGAPTPMALLSKNLHHSPFSAWETPTHPSGSGLKISCSVDPSLVFPCRDRCCHTLSSHPLLLSNISWCTCFSVNFTDLSLQAWGPYLNHLYCGFSNRDGVTKCLVPNTSPLTLHSNVYQPAWHIH